MRPGGGTQPVVARRRRVGHRDRPGATTASRCGDLAALVDFVGPHVYRMETDQVRQHLRAGASSCELAGVAGLPVVLEEFGLSPATSCRRRTPAHYYRQVLHTTLLAGATGWIAWNNTDYDDLADQDPYRHHPFEMHFGITDRHGAPKPPLLELRGFARVLDRGRRPSRCERAGRRGARRVRPTSRRDYPFTQARTRRSCSTRSSRRTSPRGRRDIRVAVRAGAGRRSPTGYGLYLLPSVKQLTRDRPGCGCRQLAEAGATVYVSYSAGEQRGRSAAPGGSHTEALFGVRQRTRLRAGRPDRGRRGDADVRRAARRHRGRRGAAFRRRRRARQPRVPAGRGARRRGRRGRRARPAGAAAQAARRRAGGACSAPTRSSTSPPREQPRSTRRRPGGSTARSPSEAGAQRPVTVADPRVLVDALRARGRHAGSCGWSARPSDELEGAAARSTTASWRRWTASSSARPCCCRRTACRCSRHVPTARPRGDPMTDTLDRPETATAPRPRGCCRPASSSASRWRRYQIEGAVARGRPRPVDLGHVQPHPGQGRRRRHRRRGLRPLPPLPRGRRADGATSGVDAYRFSVAWPRIQPDGTGPVNPAGLDFYYRLVDGCSDAGIEPARDALPLGPAAGARGRAAAGRTATPRTGSPTTRRSSQERLGDRVRRWITLNEPFCSSVLGYGTGRHAPGRAGRRRAPGRGAPPAARSRPRGAGACARPTPRRRTASR